MTGDDVEATTPTAEQQPRELDPVRYEIFRHRLFNILEEGRIAIRMVSGSPVVVEGGETMTAFYAADGTPILVAAGVLLHCMGARDFIKQAIELYEDDPGIYEGDQFFFNDPYIGGIHLPDMIVVKPIFHNGRRIAWTGSIMHTPDTGGLEPSGMMGTSTEIFHEGVRILGLKVVERGKFRPDVFRTIVDQCRDPHLVGLDTKAKIAGNNVCARSYLDLVNKYGIQFVEQASKRIIEDSERMARAKLHSLPDGTWRSRLYSAPAKPKDKPFKVVCTMTKVGDGLTFDFTGSSPQELSSNNSTYSCSWAELFIILAGQLFCDIPWNGGMIAPMRMVAPEGTVVNCRFPAACSNGVISAGMMVEGTAHACVAKMLYAGGYREDVNASWRTISGASLGQFGGYNQHGGPVGGTILDAFADGCGASPTRDGVHSGGLLRNPQSSVSDIEITEMNFPFVYLGRNQATDSGGQGKFAGGMTTTQMLMVYDTKLLTVGYAVIGANRGLPGGWGMFGGYPPAVQEARLLLNSQLPYRLAESHYPTTFDEVALVEGEIFDPITPFSGMPTKKYDLISKRTGAGGGYGDPLDRDEQKVVEDVRAGVVSVHNADKIYGVIVNPETGQLDGAATSARRLEERQKRLTEAVQLRE